MRIFLVILFDSDISKLEIPFSIIMDDHIKYYLSNSDLDTRVVDLEENGDSNGNSSVAELEVWVETLEGNADDHEARLTTTEN